tara:strand:- start:7899 stop:11570 length:3672 start_codon:yes stop_codon:yes gene_type:complete
MANKLVSLLLQVKNAMSPGVEDASESMRELQNRTRELEKELSKFDSAQAALDGLNDAKQAANEAEQAFETTQAEAVRLKQELKTNKNPDIAVALEKAKVVAAEAKKEWQQTRSTVSKLEDTLKKAGVSVDDLSGAEAELAQNSSKVNGQLKAHNQTLEQHRKKYGEVETAADQSGGAVTRWGTRLVAALGGLYVLDKIKDGFNSLAGSVYDTGVEFENLSKRLSEEDLGYIQEFAKNAPQQLGEVAEAFAQLRVYGIDPTNGSLRSAVDYNAQLGGSAESLSGIITALGQAWSKQKLQQEEVLQLIERGVPAWDLLAEATGKSVPALQDMATAGELGRKEIQLLLDAMGGAAMGQAQNQMDAMSGLVSNLQDRFTQFYRMIVDAGVWDYLKTQIREVSNWFDEMANSGQLEKLAKQISDAFITAGETIKSFVTTLYSVRNELGLLAQAWLALKITSWVGQIRNVSAGFGGLKTAIGSVTSAAGVMGTALKGAVGTLVIQQAYNLVTAYKDLKLAMAELDQAEQAAAEGKKQVADRLAEISRQAGVTVSSMADLQAAITAGRIVVDEASSSYLSAADAQELFSKRNQAAADAVADNKINVDALSESYQFYLNGLDAATKDNSKLASVLTDQVRGALNGNTESVGGLVLALKSVGQQGDLTADQIRSGLIETLSSLSSEERTRFETKIREAMVAVGNSADAAGLDVKYLQDTLDALDTSRAVSALNRLGTSQEELAGKITTGVEQSVKDLTELNAQVAELGPVSAAVSKEVYDALAGTFKNIRTELDKAALAEQVEKFRAAGQLTYAQYQELQAQLKNVGNELRDVGDAGTVAGDKIRRSMDDAADSIADAADAAADFTDRVGTQSDRVSGFAQDVGNYVSSLKNSLRELAGAEWVSEFEAKITGSTAATDALTDGVTDLSAAAAQAQSEMLGLRNNLLTQFDATGISQSLTKMKIAYNETIIAANNAAAATDSVSESATKTAAAVMSLNSTNLDALGDSADSTADSFASMASAAKSAISSIQNDLYQLRDDQEAIDKANYLSKKSSLETSLAEAQAAGATEAIAGYKEALALLEEYRSEQLAGVAIDERIANQQAAVNAELSAIDDERSRKQQLLNDAVSAGNSAAVSQFERELKSLDENATAVQAQFDSWVSALEKQRDSLGTTSSVAASTPTPDRTIQPVEQASRVVRTVEIKLGDKSVQVPENQEQNLLDILEEFKQLSGY